VTRNAGLGTGGCWVEHVKQKCRQSAFSRRRLSPVLQSNLGLVTRNAGLGTGGCWVEHVKEVRKKAGDLED
ncbi:MAG: hypothetical protein ABF765_04920, partial [Liquorilactobacillus satsumensis]|uniref:hypothetical protein n=1 Tax=Liquorilactobacillus satsumensis TaxID=259059 RepID=UPI0039EC5659